MTKFLSILLSSVLVVACSGAGADPTSTSVTTATSIPTTTSTTVAPTTTTLPATQIEGADEPLAAFIEGYYGYARGTAALVPEGPSALIPTPGAVDGDATFDVKVAVADYAGVRLAVWTAGDDVIGAIGDEKGWRVVAGAAPSVGIDPWFFDDPMLVAVVGSDARPGEDVESTRADSIHIVGLDGTGTVSVVGIPRDSYVPIAGGGTSKINSSLANGGPEMMMATFEDLSNLDLDGYVLTGFEGFEAMVDQVLQPFELDVPFAFSDKAAKADFKEGPQTVDGTDALAFARTRKAFTSGDFQRQLNGGLLLLAGAAGAKLRGPLAVPELIAGTEPWMFTDLSPARLLALSLAVHDIDLTKATNVVLEGGIGTTSGGASIVRLNQSSVEDTFSDLADGVLGN